MWSWNQYSQYIKPNKPFIHISPNSELEFFLVGLSSETGLGKIQPIGQIWPATWLYPAHGWAPANWLYVVHGCPCDTLHGAETRPPPSGAAYTTLLPALAHGSGFGQLSREAAPGVDATAWVVLGSPWLQWLLLLLHSSREQVVHVISACGDAWQAPYAQLGVGKLQLCSSCPSMWGSSFSSQAPSTHPATHR